MTKHIAKTTILLPGAPAYVQDPAQPVLTHGRELDAEDMIEPHQHPRGQLLWAAEGVLRVRTEDKVWIVPTSHAVWIPGDCLHHVVSETAARTRNLYVDPSYSVRTEQEGSAMLLLSPLMRQIIMRLTSSDCPADADAFKRLGMVAIDEINRLDSASLNLPAGRDERLRRLIGHMDRNADDHRSLEELSRLAGASVRTLERLFADETGMSFRQWRIRLKLLSSIEYLRLGKSSTTIAHTLGYRSASAFVAAFHKHFGCPPQRFLAVHEN